MSQIDIPESPIFGRPRRPWWNRILLFGVTVGTLSLVCVGIPILYFVLSVDWRLRQAIAEADRLDPGWRTLKLEAKRRPPSDEENSALVLIEARSHMPVNWPFWEFPQAVPPQERPQLAALRKQLHFLEPPVQLDEALLDALRQEVRRAGESMAVLHKTLHLPKGRYPSNYAVALNLHRVVRLLAYEALLLAQEKDVEGALASCRGLLNCGRSTGDEPSVWLRLFRVALNAMAAGQLEAERHLPELARFYLSPLRIAPFHRNQAELRCAVAMIAIERYRRASHHWPDKLADLVPFYLPKVPLDPFHDAPLRYRHFDDGIMVYSVGPDGKDNSGNLERPQDISEIITGSDGPPKQGADLGFRLWDVPKRRQPAKAQESAMP